MTAQRPIGLPGIGPRPWGSHLCHFFDSREDLASILVPFFRAGLEANERCLWVAYEPLDANAAREALGAVVEDLPEREARGQIDFYDVRDWYERLGELAPEEVLEEWIRLAEEAVENGYDGLRITGNAAWVKREQWDDFVSYESMVMEAFRERPILALCSYCLSRCTKRDVMDVFGNHHMALVPRDGRPGEFEALESAVLRLTEEELSEQRETAQVRDRLLGVLGHDLKNPLNVISLAAEELLATGDSDAARLSLRIKASARRMNRMVEDLLDYARSDLGEGIPLQSTWCYMDDVCRAVLEEVSIAHPNRHIDLVSEGSVGGHWDPERLKQAITNLLTNAIHHGDDPIRIRLRGTPALPGESSWQILEVSNRGGPIAEDDLEHLFEPFYRSWSARRRSQGLGLGLYIVREIVQAHGGAVDVKSDDEETVFRVRLPRSAARVFRRARIAVARSRAGRSDARESGSRFERA